MKQSLARCERRLKVLSSWQQAQLTRPRVRMGTPKPDIVGPALPEGHSIKTPAASNGSQGDQLQASVQSLEAQLGRHHHFHPTAAVDPTQLMHRLASSNTSNSSKRAIAP